MQIQQNFSLKKYTTFSIEAFAKEFVAVKNKTELKHILIENKLKPKFILGGGSNLLLTKNLNSLVIHIAILGKKIVQETDEFAWVECNAGENWHEFVLWTLENNLGGLENLSLIPGNVGTTPVQNIGAYGVEIKDVLESCCAIEIETLNFKKFTNQDCNFGYRESIFKQNNKGQYIITSVIFKLTKKDHKINTAYGDILKELAAKNIEKPTIKEVSNAVIAIRKSKLPDPKELGNSGSFFKNPVISKEHFEKVRKKFQDIKFFEISPTQIKVPAGWLIEKAGFKGFREGDAGVHKNQALVIVNHGNATGKEIFELSKKIQSAIFEMFTISIEAEVNVI